jgi:hypothetical protein
MRQAGYLLLPLSQDSGSVNRIRESGYRTGLAQVLAEIGNRLLSLEFSQFFGFVPGWFNAPSYLSNARVWSGPISFNVTSSQRITPGVR